jgi:hypothetical protein
LDSKRVEGGPGREWFAVTLKQASDAVHECLPSDCGGEHFEGLGANASRAAEFVEQLTPVAGPKQATEQADIDALAEKLYGNRWQAVVQASGLVRQRRLVRHKGRAHCANLYFYQLQFPGCSQTSYAAIKEDALAERVV